MLIGEAIYSKLAGTTGITELLGSTNISPLVAAHESTLPCVTYFKLMERPYHSMVSDPNIRSPRYEISVFSTSYEQVHSIAKVVKDTLQDYSGMMGGATGVNVQRVFYELEMEYSQKDPETKQITYRVIQDYIIWYSSS